MTRWAGASACLQEALHRKTSDQLNFRQLGQSFVWEFLAVDEEDVGKRLASLAEEELAVRFYTISAVATASDLFAPLLVPPPPQNFEDLQEWLDADYLVSKTRPELNEWLVEIHLIEPGFPDKTKHYIFSQLVDLLIDARDPDRHTSHSSLDEDYYPEDEIEIPAPQYQWSTEPHEPLSWEDSILFDFDPSTESVDAACERIRKRFESRLFAGNARKVTRVNVWKLTHLRRYSSVVESGFLVTSW